MEEIKFRGFGLASKRVMPPSMLEFIYGGVLPKTIPKMSVFDVMTRVIKYVEKNNLDEGCAVGSFKLDDKLRALFGVADATTEYQKLPYMVHLAFRTPEVV